jgi:Heterokaryon incompatibility protein (HET)
MRLLNVHSYEIREFFGDAIPEYAILSHTWGAEENTFQDMSCLNAAARSSLDSRDELDTPISLKKDFKKIRYSCEEAKKDRLEWVWIDTCCIDKTSSAELSEAINSMYHWYKQSWVCYAYLSDVPEPVVAKKRRSKSKASSQHDLSSSNPWSTREWNFRNSNIESLLKSSRWFTRGWTLQELIAPEKVKFFGVDWCWLGDLKHLRKMISNITGIPEGLMPDAKGSPSSLTLDDFSVAQKMSWAALRQCTRVEDAAYCLLGIFDINMPLLYGEGEKAFRRLQEEIFRASDDHSLLAWTVGSESEYWKPSSVFAKSPLNFLRSGDVVRLHEEVGAPSLSTKKGLQISLPYEEGSSIPARYWRRYLSGRTSHAFLNCGRKGGKEPTRIFLLLVKDTGVDEGITQSQCYSRLLTHQHLVVQDGTRFHNPSKYKTIYLRTHRHKYQYFPVDDIKPPAPVQVHVHSNLNHPITTTQDDVMSTTPGYTGRFVMYRTDGVAVYTAFNPDNMVVLGGCFVLRMVLNSSTGLPPLEALCKLQRTKGRREYVQIWLESPSEIGPPERKATFHFVKIDRFDGDLISVSLPVEGFTITMTVKCKRSWDEESGFSGTYHEALSEYRVHFHVDFSYQVISTDKILSDLSHRTWRVADFFSIFERTEYFIVWFLFDS